MADERYHAPGASRSWSESWYFDFATLDGRFGGYVRLCVYPNDRACWYWASIVGEGRPLVTVLDHGVAPPRPPSLEIRAEGLWADHTIEVPFDHVTLGCEAFALAVDDPAELDDPAAVDGGGLRGDRVPLGLDLEWETDGHVYPYPGGVTHYGLPCRVHGEVLIGDERIEVDAVGQRGHSWGDREWSTLAWTFTSGRLDDGTRFHGTALHQDGEVVPYHPGYVQAPGGGLVPAERTAAAERLDEATGFPRSACVTVGDLTVEVHPVAFAPVPLSAPNGRASRLCRALCRYDERATGRSGVGWTEWHQVRRAGA